MDFSVFRLPQIFCNPIPSPKGSLKPHHPFQAASIHMIKSHPSHPIPAAPS
ncbi:hypothetical protein [Kingella oralis]|uniref:hypothetical protein n=1 Tax=Kingella oralis TaxID=505 RepID=UPI002D7F7D8E|nr:hypothetical protein [Kingella oralis]